MNVYAKVPLVDEAAERITLGSMMLSPSSADEVLEILTSRDFYSPRHSSIFAAITAAHASGSPAEPIALLRLLAEAGEVERIGGAQYLAELLEAVPTAVQASHYAKIVADWSARRRIQAVALRLEQLSGDLTRSVPEMIDAAQSAVHVATTTGARDATSYAELTRTVATELQGETAPGLPTGLRDLDRLIGKLKPGQLAIVGARPGVGKSVLLTVICRAAALRLGEPTLLFSLEMSEGEVTRRLLAAELDIPLRRLIHSRPQPADLERLNTHSSLAHSSALRIDGTRPLDLGALRSKARRMRQRHGLSLIVVDYLQLMSTTHRGSRAEEIGEISRGLKILAGDLEVPVVVAAQLNRQSEYRSDRRPQLSDLRESGSIEADADVVILLHRDDLTDPDSPRAGEIDLIVAKNRNGAVDVVTAAAQLSYARIVDMATRSWSPSSHAMESS